MTYTQTPVEGVTENIKLPMRKKYVFVCFKFRNMTQMCVRTLTQKRKYNNFETFYETIYTFSSSFKLDKLFERY